MHFSPLTNKVIAYKQVPGFDTDCCIDWAVEMIELGYDSENILLLAGLSKPTNYFEATSYLTAGLAELGLKPKTGEDAIVSYSGYFISKIANKLDIRVNLNIIEKLCIGLDYAAPIYDFYLLWWAWSDLDYDPNAYPTYWDGVNINNIENVVIDYAKTWLAKYEATISLHP